MQNNYELVKRFPVLVKLAKSGKNSYYKIAVYRLNDAGYLETRWNSEITGNNKESKEKSNLKYIREKNVGKSNYTSSIDQALKEAEALFIRQQKAGKFSLLDNNNNIGNKDAEKNTAQIKLPLPMLLKPYDQHKSKVTYPCYASIKYDGMRMLFSGKGNQMYSRNGTFYNTDLLNHLKFDNQNYIVDGELYLDEGTSSKVQSAVLYKGNIDDVKEDTVKLTYQVFDIISPLSYDDRYKILQKIVKDADNSKIRLVESKIINNESELDQFYDEVLKQGYEGIVIRLLDYGYEVGYRSNYIFKRRPTLDDEYIVQDIVPDSLGLGMFVCIFKDGRTFTCTPKMSHDERKQLLQNRDKYLNKFLKVQYKGYTVTGLPKHANGLNIREDIDR